MSFKSRLTHHSSCVYNFSYVWHIQIKLHIELDEKLDLSCHKMFYRYITNITPLKMIFCYTILFFKFFLRHLMKHHKTGCLKNWRRSFCKYHLNHCQVLCRLSQCQHKHRTLPPWKKNRFHRVDRNSENTTVCTNHHLRRNTTGCILYIVPYEVANSIYCVFIAGVEFRRESPPKRLL